MSDASSKEAATNLSCSMRDLDVTHQHTRHPMAEYFMFSHHRKSKKKKSKKSARRKKVAAFGWGP